MRKLTIYIQLAIQMDLILKKSLIEIIIILKAEFNF